MTRFLIGAVATSAVACSLGTRARDYAPAQHAAGLRVTVITIMPQPLSGELLAVDDSSVVLVSESRVWRVAWAYTRRIQVRDGPLVYANERPPRDNQLEGLRLRSRYPQGMDSDLEARVLAAYGQETIEVFRP